MLVKLTSILSLVLLISCSGDLNVEEFHTWISQEENGLIQEVENENFKIEVQYKPQNYLVSLENRGKKLSKKNYEEELQAKEELQYFNIKLISKTGKPVLKTNVQSKSEEDLRLQYYIGAFEHDIFLADGNDTLPCVLYHFERTYGALPFNNISVAFENNHKNTKDKTLLIADRALGFDLEQFTFNKRDIKNVPSLKIN